jgi:hypothetical protein
LLITLDMCEWLPEDDLVFRLCCLGGPGRDTANDPGPDTATDEQRNSACLTAPAVPSRSVMSEANSPLQCGRLGRPEVTSALVDAAPLMLMLMLMLMQDLVAAHWWPGLGPHLAR